MTAGGRHRGPARRPVRTGGSATLALVLLVVLGLVATTVHPTRAAYTAAISGKANATTSNDYAATDLPFRDSFTGGQGAWKTYGGTWQTQVSSGYGKFLETSAADAGAKAVTGRTSWTDYTMQADVQMNGDAARNAGLLVRVTDPSAGLDAFTGYSVSLDKTANALRITRVRGGTVTQLASTTIAGELRAGQFYHVVVQAAGCGITAWSSTVGANDWTRATASESSTDCLPNGAVGVRGDTAAGFRYVAVTAGALPSATASAPYNSTLTIGSFNDGTAARVYGGSWAIDKPEERIRSTGYSGNGDKQVLNRVWGNMSLTGDVRLMRTPDGTTDAGYLVRVNDPSTGVDAFRGYSAVLDADELVIREHTNPGSVLGDSAPLGRTVQVGEWWHLTVEAVGCTITATAAPTAGGTPVSVTTTFDGCSLTTGAVGIREHGTEAEWRNIAVTPR